MKKKKPSVAELQETIGELTNKWKRALADYQNLEKRVETQQANYVRLASVGLIDKLLPVIDDLERAVQHLDDAGVKMIHSQLLDVLKSEGVEKMESMDAEFDPEFMDCAEMVAGKKNVVMEVVQEGYVMGDITIRPAKVKVGTGDTTSN